MVVEVTAQKQSRHWAQIAETGTELGMGILIFVYRVGGSLPFKICLFPVMCFYFLLRADARRASREFLLRVQKHSGLKDSISAVLVFRHFWEFALSLIDKVAVWMGDISYDQLDLHQAELIDDLIARRQGAIFAISHLGNFEVLSAMSQQHEGVHLTVLHHTHHAEKFNRILNKYSASQQVELLQVTELDAALAVGLSERVARGEFVAIASDRTPINNNGGVIDCTFLGETASFPQGAYVLSQILSAPLIMLVCIKNRDRFSVYFQQLSDGTKVSRLRRREFIEETAKTYVHHLEQYVARDPLQWFNFYNFWRRPN